VELLASTARLTEAELYELARTLERRARDKGRQVEHDHHESVLPVESASQGR
jgi:hypothetical protein